MLFNITPEAAERIRSAAQEGQMENMPLRVAAKRNPDGSIEYGMGFDDNINSDDTRFTVEGIDVIIAPVSIELLEDAVLDFAEVEQGQQHFIFMNPNDPHYVPPKKKQTQDSGDQTSDKNDDESDGTHGL